MSFTLDEGDEGEPMHEPLPLSEAPAAEEATGLETSMAEAVVLLKRQVVMARLASLLLALTHHLISPSSHLSLISPLPHLTTLIQAWPSSL